MKILLGHNYYRSSSPSGENLVYEMERDLLSRNGHTVSEFIRNSDTLSKEGIAGVIKGAAQTPWNTFVAKDVKKRLVSESTDVLHVHNTFPMISPSVFWAARGLSARVITLHNYRLFCANAIPMRGGNVCTECLDKRSAAPAMRHGCYRNSRLATAPLAANVALHRRMGTWQNQVDAFICLSNFQKELMIDAGLPKHKVHVKPNFYPGMPEVKPWMARRPAVVFAGRLGAEKGVVTLLKAWRMWGVNAPELRIVGDGPLRRELEEMAEGLPVTFLGQLQMEEAQREIAENMLQILPSEWFEGFPMVIREAFAFGTPAAVSNIGPLPSIVTKGLNGVVFEASDAASLLAEVKGAWAAPDLLQRLGVGARAEFETKYTEQANYQQLQDIYKEAKDVAKFELSKR
ncbi:glycosyltransferase family 4 protein [Marinobacter sediminum]|uniref:glycosyltransferase family 4 protein n=1 Tax=Marinobacter sediminum TaxID=256323 RepID=UPI00193A9BC1|nr:glycosyltransferase family 4 protein [Marinobacter sediminum]